MNIVHQPMTVNADSPAGSGGFALWNLGFRPLYLGASIFAALAIAAWTAEFSGWTASRPLVGGPLWHAHEMVFGYAMAVIVGFLFTAVRNWTGQPTPSGAALAAIVALWVAARLLVPTPWHGLAAAFDTAFAIAAAIGIGRPIVASRNRRNYFFIGLLLALGAANLAFYLAMAGVLAFDLRRDLQLALDVILFIMAVMGGRVIPMFTANGVPGTAPRRLPSLERTALGAVIALFAADLLGLPGVPLAMLAAAAAVAHGARFALWQPWKTLAKPIVWILHAAYAFIVLHLALRALAALDLVGTSLANHALTVGGIGILTLGMMTRTARGHTGRLLQASPPEVVVYALIVAAALVRVVVPLAAPALYLGAVIAAGALWVGAFALYAIIYWPILSRPRADGRPG
jgi:uncharacterized protein involved in response to NO